MNLNKQFDGRKLLFLAPMAGYTNGVCRRIFKEYGADSVVSEFVYSRAVLVSAKRVFDKMLFAESERPVGIQIFGSDPFEMAEAACVIEDGLNPDFIDVNFGCPAPNAVEAGAGSALLKTPKQMCAIISKISESLKATPVTAKLRTGWDKNNIIVPEVAKMLEDSGAKMLTLHGRTKSQGYEGEADWQLIEATAKSISIPLIGNGSVEKLTPEFLRNSECSGFMIGRAALGNPWIFQETRSKIDNTESTYTPPTPQERAKLAYHFAELISTCGYQGISSENLTHAKTQIMRFLKNAEGFKRLRVSLRNIQSLEELKELLCEYI